MSLYYYLFLFWKINSIATRDLYRLQWLLQYLVRYIGLKFKLNCSNSTGTKFFGGLKFHIFVSPYLDNTTYNAFHLSHHRNGFFFATNIIVIIFIVNKKRLKFHLNDWTYLICINLFKYIEIILLSYRIIFENIL